AIVTGMFQPIQAVTHYAIGGSLIDYLRSLLTTTSQFFNPLASHLKELRRSAELKFAFLLGVKAVVILTIAAGGAFVMLGDRFIHLWMGPEFAGPAGTVLRILACGILVASPQYIFGAVLYGVSRHQITAKLRIGEAIVNLGLSIWLVQIMGVAGVALGTAIPSAIVGALILPRLACPIVGVKLPEYYLHAYL